MREDKPATEIAQERAAPPPTPAKPAAEAVDAKRPVRLTHPDKVLFPEPGITKRQLADYWLAVADVALPLLRGRPLTLYRCPDGYAAQCFYQKHVGAGVPAAVPRVAITEGEDPYAVIDERRRCSALAQIGVLELHVWGSRAEHLDQPDMIVFDLDPAQDVPWSEVANAGLAVKKRLEDLGLNAFAKLTGGKGLHVVVPGQPRTHLARGEEIHARVRQRDGARRAAALSRLDVEGKARRQDLHRLSAQRRGSHGRSAPIRRARAPARPSRCRSSGTSCNPMRHARRSSACSRCRA